ncbi:MAG: hypothetical protein A2X94_17295 [Bdellovibrionales bacterium GWB1_55_8]|nr:MAG: hypothetical protein A2X94_17295 [Bdellovibrionales bacterium GWB1_55_8]
MKAALCQMNLAWQDPKANLVQVRTFLDEAKSKGADLIIFPEMCLTGFSMKTEEAAYAPDSRYLRELIESTKDCHSLVFAGVAVRRPEGPFNECWVLRDGALLATYQKVNLFSYSGEHDAYRAGKAITLLGPSESALPRICPFICYDLRFPEIFLRGAEQGAELFVVIANWPEARREQWKLLLRARALDTQAFVIGVNRVGSGDGLSYSGESAVFDPSGKQLNEFGIEEGMVLVDLDPTQTGIFRSKFPVLADRARLAQCSTSIQITGV